MSRHAQIRSRERAGALSVLDTAVVHDRAQYERFAFVVLRLSFSSIAHDLSTRGERGMSTCQPLSHDFLLQVAADATCDVLFFHTANLLRTSLKQNSERIYSVCLAADTLPSFMIHR